MLKTMVYGDSSTAGTANCVLETSAVPPQRCLSKDKAVNLGASRSLMDEWEINQKRYGNIIPFPRRRLMPAMAIVKDTHVGPQAELYDDSVIAIEYDRSTIKYDAFIPGYMYEVTAIEFNDAASISQYGQDSIVETSANDAQLGSDCREYSKGWARVRLRRETEYPTTLAEYGDVWDDTYHHITMVGYYDEENGDFYENTGTDRSVTISFRATPLSSLTPPISLPAGISFVPEDKTHTEFKVVFYHKSQGYSSQIWAQHNINTTSTVTLNHTKSANSTLDLVATLQGASTNGTYWDSTGWIHPSYQQSALSNAIHITKGSTGTSLVIDWNVIKDAAHWDSDNGRIEINPETGEEYSATSIPIYIYGCWDTMRSGGTSDGHLVGDYNQSTTVSSAGMTSKNIAIKSAGNLNKTEEVDSIARHYTCLYKIFWNTDQSTIDILKLDPWDEDSIRESDKNIGGTYGLIYPTSGFVRSTGGSMTTRNYIGNSNVVTNNTANVPITSTINGQPAKYIVTQYFPQQSQMYTETFTINGQSLTANNSVEINPSTAQSLNIVFNGTPSGSARWLNLQQVGSNEYANLSFTFN